MCWSAASSSPCWRAAYYWLPLFTGRSPRHSLGTTAFWLIFIGFNLTFLVMHWTGLVGMPRQIYGYSADAGWTLFNLVSSIGGFLLAMGFALFVVDLFLQWRFGRRADRNPWAAEHARMVDRQAAADLYIQFHSTDRGPLAPGRGA